MSGARGSSASVARAASALVLALGLAASAAQRAYAYDLELAMPSSLASTRALAARFGPVLAARAPRVPAAPRAGLELASADARPRPLHGEPSLARPERSGLSPAVFWVAASASIIAASLGGFYAVKVQNLYDEAQLQPLVSPERTRLRREMESAELTADLLLWGSLAMVVGTTILTFHVDWSGADGPRGSHARRSVPRTAAGPQPAQRSWW